MSVLVWRLMEGDPVTLAPLGLPSELQNLDQVSQRLPGGAYTTFRTYHQRKAIRLNEHIERLVETARLTGKMVQPDERVIRSGIRLAIDQAKEFFVDPITHDPEQMDDEAELPEFRLRLTLDLEQEVGAVYVAIELLPAPAPQAYQEGVRVITIPMERRLPRAKLTRFIERADPVRRSLPAGVNEAIMVDSNNYILEGLSSNFFGIQGGKIRTAGEGVLAGITRSLVLEAANEANIPVVFEPVCMDDLAALDECFITSSSRGLLPVVLIDQMIIGDGKPGPITKDLMARFVLKVQAQITEI